MPSYDYDLIVIGSGAAGSIAAQLVAKAGKNVAIIEAGTVGGECPNYACVPTKALIKAAKVYETAKNGTTFGVRSSAVSYNYPSVKAWKDLAVKRTGALQEELIYTKEGINLVHGRAYFIDPNTISVGVARFTAKNFLIATGSETVLPSIEGLAKSGFLTTREAVNLTRPPKSLAIVGGGSSGCEFAELFATFGTKIYLIESSNSLLSKEEPEAGAMLNDTLSRKYNVSIILEAEVTKVEKTALKKSLSIRRGKTTKTLLVDEILIASGKKAAVDIGLDNAGVSYDEGRILVDSHLQTSASHIFAAGDCVDIYPSTHVSAYQSRIVAHNVLHPKRRAVANYEAVPRCIYTNPEVAATGATEQELKRRGRSYKTAMSPISTVGKSSVSNSSEGFVKVIASSKTNVLLGATIVAPNASEMIHELSLAIQYHHTARQVAEVIHAFPTWSEAIRVACDKLAKQ